MRFWEDLAVQAVYDLGMCRLNDAEIAAFESQFTLPRIVMGAPRAESSQGTPVPGYLLCCVAMRCLVDGFLSGIESLGSPGVDHIDWPDPAYADEDLHADLYLYAARPLRSHSGMGLIQSRLSVSASNERTVVCLWTNAFVARRAGVQS